ncbi:unnamed protein product [Cuscuta epithymum]|uniref:Seipin-2-like n=1 Tax=Cuscuta epithymum TaxID=186058 RepID=A0AAV0EFE3_9ASTE|nr:unnamed protein product [Cuscuta epithymum]
MGKRATPNSSNSEMEFHDAADEFPFDDCRDVFSDTDTDPDGSVTYPDPKLDNENQKSHSPATTLRFRRSLQRCTSLFDSPDPSLLGSVENVSNLRETNLVCSNEMEENENEENLESRQMNGNEKLESFNAVELSSSSGTVESGLGNEWNQNSFIADRQTRLDLHTRQTDNSSILVLCSDLIIKAIAVQINFLLIVLSFTTKIFLYPIRAIYSAYMFVMDPFSVVTSLKSYILKKCARHFSHVCGNALNLVSKWLKEQRSLWSLGMRCGWGIMWSIYVAVVLVGMLVLAFVMAGLLVSYFVEEPMKMVEDLNFDYTQKSPVAFVPLTGCHVDGGMVDGMHYIPPNHKLQATVTLTLPESDYNRNLGVFQVRVDFLTSNGMVRASSRKPCILPFKSQHIRLLTTFFKVASLVTGYTAESQDLAVEFRGFTEGDMPTACVRVVIEQRAEFHPGGGIPQLYAASLVLESQLPLLKRVIWYWKSTLFVWLSMLLFLVELVSALLCCKPLIIPTIHLMGSPSRRA